LPTSAGARADHRLALTKAGMDARMRKFRRIRKAATASATHKVPAAAPRRAERAA